jgi:hypothetical protein
LKELEENEEWKTFWVGFLFRFFSPSCSFWEFQLERVC